MWPKATNVLGEFYLSLAYGAGGEGGRGSKGALFYWGGGGGNGMFVPPTFNPTFLFSN